MSALLLAAVRSLTTPCGHTSASRASPAVSTMAIDAHCVERTCPTSPSSRTTDPTRRCSRFSRLTPPRSRTTTEWTRTRDRKPRVRMQASRSLWVLARMQSALSVALVVRESSSTMIQKPRRITMVSSDSTSSAKAVIEQEEREARLSTPSLFVPLRSRRCPLSCTSSSHAIV